MNISKWPISERPREQLLSRGASALTDSDLLAIFIHTGVKGKTAVDLARELLTQAGDFRKLLTLSLEDFQKIRGLGVAKYVMLQASLEIARRYFAETMKYESVIGNSFDVLRYLMTRLRDQSREIFACIFLNNQHRVLAYEELTQGSINTANIYPRELVKRILAHNASSIILAHNHTSGIAIPSEADRQSTQELKKLLKNLEVELLDHVIIGDGEYWSFAEKKAL